MAREYVIVERIVEDIVLLELANRQQLSLPLVVLPQPLREGDCLYLSGGRFYIDKEETERRRQSNARRLNSLWDFED